MLLPPPGRNHHTEYNTQGVALGYLVVGPSDRHCTDELLINPNPRYDGLVSWRLWCLTAFPPFGKTIWKKPTKTCRGKVMKEKLKSVKTTLHPSFFILHFIIFHSIFSHRLGFAVWKVSFHRPKGYVSPPETWSFVQRNLTFRKFIFSRPPDDKLTFV